MGALLSQFMNKYPYTDFHELNADWLIKTLMEMINQVENFVSLNAIKYADPIQWDIVRQYEKNTVVIDPLTGTAYISVQPVPSGVALTRTEYWTVVFDLGSFVTRAAKNFSNRYETNTTLTATFSTTAGDWLVWGDTLYEALVNITAGDQYVVDSNIRHITMEEVVNALAQAIQNVQNNVDLLDAKVGDLNDLDTSIKTSVVNAINSLIADRNNIIYNVETAPGADDDAKLSDAITKADTDGAMFFKNATDSHTYNNTNIASAGLNENITEFRNTENGGVFNILVGHDSPNTDQLAPTVFVQKTISHSQGSDFKSHSFGAGDFECIGHGSGDGDNPSAGGYVALVGLAKNVSVNTTGDYTNQKWDFKGVTIGLLGEAITDGYNAEVTAGVWANVASCNLTDNEFDNLPVGAQFTTIGEEINCWIRHKDAGYKPYLTGPGNVVGLFINNYQEYFNETPRQKNFTFAININGTPVDGDYSNNDIDDWNSHYTGIEIDKIIHTGIHFGGYMANGSIGIEFMPNYSIYAQRPENSIALGDTLMNMGSYFGATAKLGDFGRSGKNLVYCRNAVNSFDVVMSTSKVSGASVSAVTAVNTTTDPDTGDIATVTPTSSVIADRKIRVYLGGEEIELLGMYVGPEP